MVEGGAARFSLDARPQRAEEGEPFVLEPEAVHTGMAAVPRDGPTRCSTWSRSYCTSAQSATGSRRVLLGGSSSRTLRCALACFVFMPPWLRSRQVWESMRRVLYAIDALRPHLRPGPPERVRARAEHAAVRRARQHLCDRWDQWGRAGRPCCGGGTQSVRAHPLLPRGQALTPRAYQVNLRISRARALLVGGMTPAVVAAECGFSDEPHLTRTFKRAVGVSPGRYARCVVG